MHTNLYVAGRLGRDVVDRGRDAGEDLALEDGRARIRRSVRCCAGVPGSSLSKAIVNGLPAGRGPRLLDEGDALGLDVDVGGRAARRRRGPPTPRRRRPRAPDARRALAVAAVGLRRWRRRRLEDRRADDQDDQARRAAATASARCRDVLEVAGRVGLDRLAVLLDGVGRASRPGSTMSAMTPTASSQPPKTRPRKSSEDPERAEERPPRRPGHVDAGRRSVVDDGRQGRGRSAPMSWS